MIRAATLADVPAVAEMGERFHAEAGWPDIVTYVRGDCEKTLAHMVENEDGILLVVDLGGRIVGMAGGLAHPFYFNFSHKTGAELFWWVEPGLRDGIGRQLLDRLEDEARARGCVSWGMAAVDRLKPEVMAKIYRRRGYRASEHTFIKRLDA